MNSLFRIQSKILLPLFLSLLSSLASIMHHSKAKLHYHQKPQIASQNHTTCPLGPTELTSPEGILQYQFTHLRYLDAAVEGTGITRAVQGNKHLAQVRVFLKSATL